MSSKFFNNTYYTFVMELNRCLKNNMSKTGWIKSNKFILNFCDLLVRQGVIYSYKNKKKNDVHFVQIFFVLNNGYPLILKFKNYFYFNAYKRPYLFQVRASGLVYKCLFLTPYGFLSLEDCSKYTNINKVFIGYIVFR